MTKISCRQICFIMLIYTAVSKFIIYPTYLSYYTGRDLLFSALINFAVQGVIVWSVSYLCSRTDKTFFGLLKDTFGNIFARIIFGLFALFFLLATINPLFEQKLYVHDIFYDTVPSLMIFLPVFFFLVYASAKPFLNIGRCADICLPLFLLSMLLILVMSLHEVKFDNFLPVFTQPKKIFSSSLASVFRFIEPAYLLMFMGRFRYKKGDAAKITISYIGGAVFVLVVLAAFYGIYGDVAPTRHFAISKISLFFPAIDLVGRIDLLALYVLEITMLFALVLNIQLAIECIAQCTGYENRAVLSVAVNAVFFLILIFCDNKYNAISTLFSKWMWIVFLIFANLVPLASWFLRKKNEED